MSKKKNWWSRQKKKKKKGTFLYSFIEFNLCFFFSPLKVPKNIYLSSERFFNFGLLSGYGTFLGFFRPLMGLSRCQGIFKNFDFLDILMAKIWVKSDEVSYDLIFFQKQLSPICNKKNKGSNTQALAKWTRRIGLIFLFFNF